MWYHYKYYFVIPILKPDRCPLIYFNGHILRIYMFYNLFD